MRTTCTKKMNRRDKNAVIKGSKKLLKGAGIALLATTITILAIVVLAKLQINVWDEFISPTALSVKEMKKYGVEDPTCFSYVIFCLIPHGIIIWTSKSLLLREECMYVYRFIHYMAKH